MLKGLVTRHKAGEMVQSGIYWNRKGWGLTIIDEEGGCLSAVDGDGSDFYRLPVLLVMLLSPLAGLAFILFLAVAVPVMVVYSVPKAMTAAIRRRRATRGTFRPAGQHRWRG